ncbi:hypothetical protein EG329_009673 [Mollisiaceae sp. DMI_Dod_QoI]|nr:hypothetical protein EG329_009673 [Helotiales sp. DMI_Dod_QoI]
MREVWMDGRDRALLPLLRRFSGRKASDDRDKVFALLSLAPTQTQITPDYTLSVSAVFQTTVLDIFKTTKSLSVLAGDLGRKDRQDLPSWVPDWSAVYDDLDRRRAENTENYNATGGSVVYVQDEGAKKWSGIRQLLNEIRESLDAEMTLTGDYVKKFSHILGTSDWIDWLPDENEVGVRASEMTCLAAISSFKASCGDAVCLQNCGDGIVELAGLNIDTIAVTSETAFSDDVLLSVIHSWAAMAVSHVVIEEHSRKGKGLGDAFRRTICADIVPSGSDTKGFTTRRMDSDDHSQIAAWFWQRVPQDQLLDIFQEELFGDLGKQDSHMPPTPMSRSIDTAIRSATVRRTFFITEQGYIGLGPAKMRTGDHLFILLGSKSPFILRDAGSRKIPSRARSVPLGLLPLTCFEVIGDCYTHGIMDGEAMQEWKKATNNTKLDSKVLQEYINQLMTAWEYKHCELSSWKSETSRSVLLKKMADHGGYDLYRFSGQHRVDITTRSSWHASERERARFYTSDLAEWKHEFDLMKNEDWMEYLIEAAEEKVAQVEKEVADQIYRLDRARSLIEMEDQSYYGRVYLV